MARSPSDLSEDLHVKIRSVKFDYNTEIATLGTQLTSLIAVAGNLCSTSNSNSQLFLSLTDKMYNAVQELLDKAFIMQLKYATPEEADNLKIPDKFIGMSNEAMTKLLDLDPKNSKVIVDFCQKGISSICNRFATIINSPNTTKGLMSMVDKNLLEIAKCGYVSIGALKNFANLDAPNVTAGADVKAAHEGDSKAVKEPLALEPVTPPLQFGRGVRPDSRANAGADSKALEEDKLPIAPGGPRGSGGLKG